MKRPSILVPALVLLLLACVAPAVSGEREERIAGLPPEHRQWLEDVELLISPEEIDELLAIDKDYHARREFPHEADERRRMFLLNGEPHLHEVYDCRQDVAWPLEIWWYDESDQVTFNVWLIFYQPSGSGPYRLWDPRDGHRVFFVESPEFVQSLCERTRDPLKDLDPQDPEPSSRFGPPNDVSYRCAARMLLRNCDSGRLRSNILRRSRTRGSRSGWRPSTSSSRGWSGGRRPKSRSGWRASGRCRPTCRRGPRRFRPSSRWAFPAAASRAR